LVGSKKVSGVEYRLWQLILDTNEPQDKRMMS